MLQRHSPLVPSEKAIDILEDLNILAQVDANIPYIQDEVEKRAQIAIYREIEDPEERLIEIAPSVIHALIKNLSFKKKALPKKYIYAKPSMIYSQIDMLASKDRVEVK